MPKQLLLTKKSPIYRLSSNARVALRTAGTISNHLKAENITPEHIFVGILLNENALASRTISEMGIDRGDLIKKSFGGKTIDITKNTSEKITLNLSLESKELLRKAYDWSQKLSHVYVGTEHLMMTLLQSEEVYIKDLKKLGLDPKSFRKKLSKFAVYPIGLLAQPDIPGFHSNSESIIEYIGINLVDLAKDGELDPVVGRDEEIDQLVNVLSRRKKNNPIVIGEAGVGKTVLVEGLAQKIAEGHVPPSLKDMKIISLDVASIMAGSRMRGDVEEKVMAIIDEVMSSEDTILFIDEIHNIIGSGIPGSSSDISSVLKPALVQEGFRCIGATTSEEYSAYFESDSALARRFQPIYLEEANPEDALEILKNIKPILEAHHSVNISDEALEASVYLSDRYVSDRFLPDKAIDLLDEVAASKRLSIENGYKNLSQLISKLKSLGTAKETEIMKGHMDAAERLNLQQKKLEKKIEKIEKECNASKRKKGNEIVSEDVKKVISKWTGIPLKTLGKKEKSSLVKLNSVLEEMVVGQTEAVDSVASAIKRARVGISNEDRPWASFLFLGPTGVGKTELAKALTKTLFGDEDRLIQIDMSEMMEMHSVSKLIGSPPGYVGFQQGGRLTEQVRRNPHSVILFDEIEKAHPDVLNVLLQILEYGHLTDGRGKKVDFKNTVVILTSNIGAEEISQDKVLGFVGKKNTEKNDEEIENAYSSMEEILTSELKKTLRPELLNRLDDIVIFRSLTRKDARKIVKILLKELNRRLERQKVQVKLKPDVVKYLVKEGFSNEYGARPLRRLLQDRVENVVAEYLLINSLEDTQEVVEIQVGMEDNKVVVLN